jgi:hypothetical protein
MVILNHIFEIEDRKIPKEEYRERFSMVNYQNDMVHNA